MSVLLRILAILWVACRHRLDLLLLRLPLPGLIRLLFWLMPWRYLFKPVGNSGGRLRKAMIELGPVFIKFGQMLSTRSDTLSPELTVELTKLLDQVPPFSSTQAETMIEAALGQSVNTAFAAFERQPLASASVSQIHAAQLSSGEAVIVKVIRPGIREVIRRDIGVLRLLAHILHWRTSNLRRLRLQDVIDEYEKTIIDELDLRREAANASQMRRSFADSELLYIPKIHWALCNRQILVQERIQGIPINDLTALDAAGIDRAKLASNGVEIFFTQVFRDNFFHADMHPGNIFVNPKQPHQPQYMAVDFGIMGSLEISDQAYLARILLAFFKRDYRQIAQLHVDCGWLPKETPVNEFEGAIRTVSEPIFSQPLGQISFAEVLLGLFHTAGRFNMEIQPQLVLLQKTIFHIEGLGRQLYPQLDLWKTAQPVLEQWVKQQIGPPQVLKRIRQQWPDLAWQLPQLPGLVYQVLNEQQKARPSQSGKKHIRSTSDLMRMALVFGCVSTSLWLMPVSITTAFVAAPYSLILLVGALLILWRR